ncbi:Phosphotransferase enzyme family protein [Sphingobium faniae]|nr:Phosphotransferase enzyme family protein [Sphingobium faniae]
MTSVKAATASGPASFSNGPAPLLPTSPRLMDAARIALAQVMEREPLSDASQNQLRVIDAILVKLDRRDTDGGYARCHESGRALLASRPNCGPVPPALSRHAGFAQVSRDIGIIAERLAQAGKQALAEGDAAFPDAAMAWEASLYALRMAPTRPDIPPEPARIRLDGLAAYLDARGMALLSHNKLVGGFQKDTILLSVSQNGGESDLVIRAQRPDRFVRLDAGYVVDEFAIVKTIHDCGGTVARPLWVESDASCLGAAFMVSDRVAGRTPSSGLVPEALSDAELRQIVETLADLHGLDADAFRPTCIGHWLDHPDLAANSRAAVAAWDRQIWTPAITASPSAAIVLDWLDRNAPDRTEAPVLLHVDYGPHNMVMRDGKVAAILDWESARIGDRTEDLSYLLLYLGERADREAMIAWYEDRAGVRICRSALAYFDVYNTIKMIMGSAFANALVEHDRQAAIEWCHVGFYTLYQGIVAARAMLGPLIGKPAD